MSLPLRGAWPGFFLRAGEGGVRDPPAVIGGGTPPPEKLAGQGDQKSRRKAPKNFLTNFSTLKNGFLGGFFRPIWDPTHIKTSKNPARSAGDEKKVPFGDPSGPPFFDPLGVRRRGVVGSRTPPT